MDLTQRMAGKRSLLPGFSVNLHRDPTLQKRSDDPFTVIKHDQLDHGAAAVKELQKLLPLCRDSQLVQRPLKRCLCRKLRFFF